MNKNKRWRAVLSLGTALLCCTAGRTAVAEVTLDGTLGPGGALAGPNYVISDSVGQTRGNNLFHSFGQFNLTSAESATFTGAANIQNIIGRVTGGASSIDGLIQSNISGANLYLVNPNGIMFGANARLNVSGSFHATTADYLRLGDGGRFDARDPGNSVLTSAPPVAFGFLGNQTPAPITVQGSSLVVPNGATLSLIGGDLDIQGTGSFGTSATLYAPGGHVLLAAVASAGEVTPGNGDMSLAGFGALGTVSLSNAAWVTNHNVNTAGGAVVIRGGQLTMDFAAISAGTESAIDHQGNAVDIRVSGAMQVVGAEISASSWGSGRAGNIHIESDSLALVGGSPRTGYPNGFQANIGSRVLSSGNGGNVDITANSVTLTGNASIRNHVYGAGRGGDISIQTDALTLNAGTSYSPFISTQTHGAGSAGNITLDAQHVQMSGGIISSQVSTSSQAAANAGTITLRSNTIEMREGSWISSSVNSGTGQGGNISIAADTITITGRSANAYSGLFSTTYGYTTQGNAGAISVQANQLTLDNLGRIEAGSSSLGDAGAITLNVRDLSISRGAYISNGPIYGGPGADGAPITINSDSIRLSGGGPAGTYTGIFSLAGAYAGNAGDITINTRTLDVANGAEISSRTNGAGTGGTVSVNADRVTVAGYDAVNNRSSRIEASTEIYPGYGAFSTGRGGNVVIAANQVNVDDRGTISVRSTGAGDAGHLTIRAHDLQLNGGQIVASASGSGAGGNIQLSATNVALANQALVTASSSGSGRAGSITVAADQLTLSGHSAITTSSAQGDGGNITVLARSLVHLSDSSISAAAMGGSGNGGNIYIDPDFVILESSQISANAFGGNGGNVTIVAGQFLATPDSSVTASSALGIQGNVVIQSPTRDINAELQRLPETVVDAAALFRSTCSAVGSRYSSFVVAAPGMAAGTLDNPYAGIEPLPAPHTDRVDAPAPLTVATASGCVF